MTALVSRNTWHHISHHPRLLRVATYLATHIYEPVSLTTAAGIACMERTAFARFFRRSTGMSYMHFVHSLRLTRALLLMCTCDDSLTQIAHTVGYTDISTFERRFKHLLGMPPSVYRKRARHEVLSGGHINIFPQLWPQSADNLPTNAETAMCDLLYGTNSKLLSTPMKDSRKE
jgi:AraC-like DNA-binding protein